MGVLENWRRRPKKSLLNQRFGKLVVIGYDGHSKWLCKCDCGRQKNIKGYSLTAGQSRSCGYCLNPRRDLTGQKFGKLTAIKPVDSIRSLCGHSNIRWLFKCDCGAEKLIRMGSVVRNGRGSVRSCGCSQPGLETRNKNLHDFIGMRFGRRTVIGISDNASGGQRRVILCCDCGSVDAARIGRLLRGESYHCKSCHLQVCHQASRGRAAHNRKEITNQRFGRLVAICRDTNWGTKNSRWFFRCDCGTEKSINMDNVLRGRQKSCGCLLTKWQKSENNRLRLIDVKFRRSALAAWGKHYIQRASAREEGHIIYEGSPCLKCGNIYRYTNSHGACVSCNQRERKRRWPQYYARNYNRIRSQARKQAKSLTDLTAIVQKISPELITELKIKGKKNNPNYASGRRKLMHIVSKIRPELLIELGLTNGRMENDTTIGT